MGESGKMGENRRQPHRITITPDPALMHWLNTHIGPGSSWTTVTQFVNWAIKQTRDAHKHAVQTMRAGETVTVARMYGLPPDTLRVAMLAKKP